METKTKPVNNGKDAKPSNGSEKLTNQPTAIKEEAKKELKQLNSVERILHELAILNAKQEQRELMLDTHKKLKSFNPTLTEGGCTLIIKEKNLEFRTSSTEPLKMIISSYISMVETKLKEVEGDITHIAGKLAS